MTSGIIFFVCWKSWVSWCSLAPFQWFSFWSDRKAERHDKETSRRDFQWRFTDGEAKNGSSDGEICQLGFYAVRGARGKTSARLGMSGRPGECRWRDRVVKLAQGNLCRPPKAQKSSILKWEDRKELKIQILWNGTTGRYLRTQPVQGDSYGQQRQAQSFKTWSKWTVSTWRRSSISY